MLNKIQKYHLDSIFFFSFTFFLLYRIFLSGGYTDIEAHAKYIIELNNGKAGYTGYFLYFLIVNILSGFTLNLKAMFISSAIIMGLSKVFLYKITLFQISKVVQDNKKKLLFSVALILFFCIPDPYSILKLHMLYMGKIVPNVWHNSTIIFALPLGVLLFLKQASIFNEEEKYTLKNIGILILLILLNIISKPSFALVYIPVTALYALSIYGFNKRFFKSLITPFIGGILILLQFYLLFITQEGLGERAVEESGVMLSLPFETYIKWYPAWYLPIALFLSLAFPISFYILKKKELSYSKNREYYFSLLLLIVGMLYSFFVIEKGARKYDGNFMWQTMVVYFIHLLAVVKLWLPEIKMKFRENSKTDKIVLIIFFTHVLGGVFYLIKLFITTSFM